LKLASLNVPETLYVPGASGTFTKSPWCELCLATTIPLASVTTTVPASGTDGGREQCRVENRTSGPPTRKKPDTSSVRPAVGRGSLNAGGYAAIPKQSGLVHTVTLAARCPGAGVCRPTVCTDASLRTAPFLRSWQPARVAAPRAVSSVRPVRRGTRQVEPAGAPAASLLAAIINPAMTTANSAALRRPAARPVPLGQFTRRGYHPRTASLEPAHARW